MPAFNEAANISKNLRETVDTLARFGYEFEVIVVDDGSPDDTWRAATDALRDHHSNVRVLRYDRNEGKGNAVMRGTAVATGDYITVKAIAELAMEVLGLTRTQLVFGAGNRGWKGDVPVIRLDIHRIQALGWKCQRSTREALRASMAEMVDDAKAGRL